MEEFIEYLLEDYVIHRTSNRHKQECLGNIPRGKDFWEGLTAGSSDKVKYLNSNELWEDEEFRVKFDSLNVHGRVIFNELSMIQLST